MLRIRKNQILKATVFILVLAFYGSLLVHKIELPAGDDMGRHIKNGELMLKGDFDVLYTNKYSYTEPGHPFVNHNWLSGVIFYLLHSVIGWSGLVIFKTVVLLLALSLVIYISIKRSNFWLVAALSIPAILVLRERTTLRPEIFSFLFISLYLYLLNDFEENPESKKIYWLIPLQLLWVNMHLFFIVGVALVGGFLLEKIIINDKNPIRNRQIKILGLLLFILITTTFINPNGWRGGLYPLNIFNNYGFDVRENNSISDDLKLRVEDTVSIRFFEVSGFIFILSFLFNYKNQPIFYFLAGTTMAVGGVKMVRLISYFSLIFLPAVSTNLSGVIESLKKSFNAYSISDKLKRIPAIIIIVLLLCLAILGGTGQFSSRREPGIGLTEETNDSVAFFKAQGLKGPIFNNFDLGSYLVYSLYPGERVFVDNRPEAHSASFLENVYLSALRDEDSWVKLNLEYSFNTIFVNQYDEVYGVRQFLQRRSRDPQWSLVYADSGILIFVKNNNSNATIINRFKITAENVEDRLDTMVNSEKFQDQIAAADVFNLLERFDLGIKSFYRILERWPEKGRVWLALGVLESNYNPQLAVAHMEKAVELGYKTPETYYYLSKTYLKIGEREKAKTALEKVLEIDPDYLNSR